VKKTLKMATTTQKSFLIAQIIGNGREWLKRVLSNGAGQDNAISIDKDYIPPDSTKFSTLRDEVPREAEEKKRLILTSIQRSIYHGEKILYTIDRDDFTRDDFGNFKLVASTSNDSALLKVNAESANPDIEVKKGLVFLSKHPEITEPGFNTFLDILKNGSNNAIYISGLDEDRDEKYIDGLRYSDLIIFGNEGLTSRDREDYTRFAQKNFQVIQMEASSIFAKKVSVAVTSEESIWSKIKSLLKIS
jgi:hypothetical protein